MTTPFTTVEQPEQRTFYDRDGNPIIIPVLHDLTPNEEIMGLDLQESWDKADNNRLSRSVEYRVQAVSILLSSRSGNHWTPDDVKKRLTSKTTRALFALYQSEITDSMQDMNVSGQDEAERDPKPLEHTGQTSSGESSDTSPTTPDSAVPDSETSPSG